MADGGVCGLVEDRGNAFGIGPDGLTRGQRHRPALVVLDDLISEHRIDPQLAMKILANFDRSIAETLQDKVKELCHVILFSQIMVYIDRRMMSNPRYETDRIAFIHDSIEFNGVLNDTFEGFWNDHGKAVTATVINCKVTRTA